MKSINFIEEEECPKHSDSVDIPDFRDIYHGCMSREVSVKTLRASGRDKCYLVRKRINAEETGEVVEYILSFVYGEDDYHFKIKKEQKYFIFANRYFPSFKCVISHYMVSNIINNAHLEFAVVNKTITAIRESLRGLPCYLSESLSDERMKELLCNNNPGSYLFRPRTDDNNQFVLMFFDGLRIHKVKMDVRLVERKFNVNGGNNDENEGTQPVVVLVLGRNYFETWKDMVQNFRVNPIVPVNDPNCIDKLVKEVDVNRNVNLIEQEDIYRKLKFNQALQQTDVFSIHGEVLYSEGSKMKWKSVYANVDKVHGNLILKNSKTFLIELIRCIFIPINYSVHQKYCFLLLYREASNGAYKNYYFSMCDNLSPDRKDYNTEETYAYRQYNLKEHDKEVYHSTEAGSANNVDTLLCRAYDRWVMAVKRHCSNTKDDIANEENPERHSKLHRYNRRLRLQIGHSGGTEISLSDADIPAVPFINQFNVANHLGQFEVMVGNHVIYTLPRKSEGAQTILFQDLPSNINDVSVVIRMKVSKRKEFVKELCNYRIAHQELVPKPTSYSLGLQSNPICDQNNFQSSASFSLSNTVIQPDAHSTCGPVAVDCYASIEYKELTILPFINYAPLSKHFMENLQSIFSNKYFMESFNNAIDQDEFKKLLNCFLYMAIWEKKQVDFMYIFFEADIKGCDSNCYFRNNSAASKLFIDYVSQFASDWFVLSFVKLFQEIYLTTDLLNNVEHSADESGSPELGDKQSIQDQTMYNCLNAALSGINKNFDHCPLTLRQLFNRIQSEVIRRHPACNDGDEGLHYRLLTNLVMLRLFCAVLNMRGEKQNGFFRNISKEIRRTGDPKFADFPKNFSHQEPLNEFLVKISKYILSTYSHTRSNDKLTEECKASEDRVAVDINQLSKSYRDKTLQSLNDNLTKPLQKSEIDKISSQLDDESHAICRLSLSRRFNDALEFLTKLQDDPSYFIKSSTTTFPSKFVVISQELSAIVDDINQKKSCSNTSFVDRL